MCQKIVKNCSKICQKLSKIGQKIVKNCQKWFKNGQKCFKIYAPLYLDTHTVHWEGKCTKLTTFVNLA
jgi:hypothetical protein